MNCLTVAIAMGASGQTHIPVTRRIRTRRIRSGVREVAADLSERRFVEPKQIERLSAKKSEPPGSTRGYDGRRRDSADFGGSGFCGATRWVGYLINTTMVTAAQ